MALAWRLTRTASTARPVVGQASHANAARRRVMAKEAIRNASVFRPVHTQSRSKSYRAASLRARRTRVACPVVIRRERSGLRPWTRFAAGLRKDRQLSAPDPSGRQTVLSPSAKLCHHEAERSGVRAWI